MLLLLMMVMMLLLLWCDTDSDDERMKQHQEILPMFFLVENKTLMSSYVFRRDLCIGLYECVLC